MFSSMLNFLLEHLIFLALHAESASAFPKPLSPAKQQEYFRRFAQGDSQARTKLIEHNLRLVAHIVKKYYASGAEQDDLISIGSIGLIKAVDTFSADKNIRFATYASRCIENEILMFFRSRRKSAEDVSIQEPIDCDKDGNPLTLLDVMAGEEEAVFDTIQQRSNAAQLRKAADRCLEPREAFVLEKRYGLDGSNPLPQREVAKQMGISRSYVSRLEKKALGQLRQELERMGYSR